MNSTLIESPSLNLTDPTTFDIVAYSGGIIRENGEPGIVDLEGLEIDGRVPVSIIGEDSRVVIGYGKVVNELFRLRVVGNVTMTSRGNISVQRVFGMAARGHKWQARCLFDTTESTFLETGETSFINGQEIEGPVVAATSSKLVEVVIVGMSPDAGTDVVFAEADGVTTTTETDSEFVAWLESIEIDPDTLNEEATAVFLNQFKTVEQERMKRLMRLRPEVDAELVESAISRGWSVGETLVRAKLRADILA